MTSPTAREPIGSEIVFDLPSVSSPALSPDGETVAYVRAQVSRETMTGEAHIRAVAFTGGNDRRLTAGPRDSSPAWSPDGSQLAFLRAADAKAPRQLWLLPMSGGEAQRLTDLPYQVESCAWLPDGSGLIAVADVDPERLIEDDGAPRTTVLHEVYYRGDTLGYRVGAWHHLFSIDASNGAATQLTSGPYNNAHPVISPDGRWIAFATDRSVERDRRRPFGSELCVIPARGGVIERLTPGAQSAGRPAWSPDGRELAVAITEVAEPQQAYLTRIHRYSGRRTRLTDGGLTPQSGFFPLASPPPISWSESGITFAADACGRSGVWRVSPDGNGEAEVIRAEAELLNGVDLSADGSRIAAIVTDPGQPGELVTQTAGAAATSLTSVSAEYLAAHEPGAVEWFTIVREGVPIPCGLMFPPGFDASQQYPLVLEIHGGPHGWFGEGFTALHQIIAGAGFLVLFVNPRGSSTFGSDFTHAVIGDWGGEDSLDLLAALDHVCARPYVDAKRLGVHGYSYGGFMTSWLIGHTDRFKAAVAGAPVINLESMYGTSDIGASWGRYQWSGRPDEAREWYRERSPITYAANVTARVLLLHGDADHRVPITQSEEYFVALRDRGKPVEFVRFPGGSHLMLRVAHPKLRQEYYDRLTTWLARYV